MHYSFSGFCGFLLLLCLIGTLIDWAKEAFGDPVVEIKGSSVDTLTANSATSLNPYSRVVGDNVGQSNNMSHEKDNSEAISADTHENVFDGEHRVGLSSDNIQLLPNRRYTQCHVWSKIKGTKNTIFVRTEEGTEDCLLTGKCLTEICFPQPSAA